MPSGKLLSEKTLSLIGKKFGHMTILGLGEPTIGSNGYKKSTFRLQCDCENKTIVTRTISSVRSGIMHGNNFNCGCLRGHNFIDITGKRFGAWLVLRKGPTEYSDENNKRTARVTWECLCDPEYGGCGTIKLVKAGSLHSGSSTSCGCIPQDHSTHGKCYTRLYNIYKGMIRRCYLPSCESYERYGGRGIYICEEWYPELSYIERRRQHNPGFLAFYNWAMENGYHDPEPDQHRKEWLTIDRKDNDGPYAPWNCRWVTQKEQISNRENTKTFTINDTKITYTEIVERFGGSVSGIIRRVNSGWLDIMNVYTIVHPELKIRLKDGQYIDKKGNVINPDEINVPL